MQGAVVRTYISLSPSTNRNLILREHNNQKTSVDSESKGSFTIGKTPYEKSARHLISYRYQHNECWTRFRACCQS